MIEVEIAVELCMGKCRTMFKVGVLTIPPPIPSRFVVRPAKRKSGIAFLKLAL